MPYKICNPRNIPSPVRVMVTVDKKGNETEWFEDDVFIQPNTMTKADLQELVARGFLEVVDG